MNLHDIVNLIELLAALYVGWRVTRWWRRRQLHTAVKQTVMFGFLPTTLLAIVIGYLLTHRRGVKHETDNSTCESSTDQE